MASISSTTKSALLDTMLSELSTEELQSKIESLGLNIIDDDSDEEEYEEMTYISNGKANGRQVFMSDAKKYFYKSGNKRMYIPEEKVRFGPYIPEKKVEVVKETVVKSEPVICGSYISKGTRSGSPVFKTDGMRHGTKAIFYFYMANDKRVYVKEDKVGPMTFSNQTLTITKEILNEKIQQTEMGSFYLP